MIVYMGKATLYVRRRRVALHAVSGTASCEPAMTEVLFPSPRSSSFVDSWVFLFPLSFAIPSVLSLSFPVLFRRFVHVSAK